MERTIRPAVFLLLVLPAAIVGAETYKWVDAKGVVNYSSTPPPASAAKPQVVAERVSVMPTDPTFAAAAAGLDARLARRAQYEEEDYARRQQYMLEAQLTQMNYAAAADAYAAAAYAPYYGYGGWGYLTGAGRRYGPQATPYRASFRHGSGASLRPGAGAAHGRGAASAARGSVR